VVGGGNTVVMVHNTVTCEVLWRKDMPGWVESLRIHGGVVVVAVENSNTEVLDVTTGHQLHTLPSAAMVVKGLCVFDGMTSNVVTFADFHPVILSQRH
jgi:hypothetical protein